MANEEVQNYGQAYGDSFSTLQLSDLEEKHNILKDRILLIGKNLVEVKDKTNEKILEIKKDLEVMKHEIERIKSFIDSVSSQLGRLAKKEDLEILAKQLRMFRPFLNKD